MKIIFFFNKKCVKICRDARHTRSIRRRKSSEYSGYSTRGARSKPFLNSSDEKMRLISDNFKVWTLFLMKNMNPKYKISRLKPKTKIPSSQYNSIITAMFKGHRQPKQQTERVRSLWLFNKKSSICKNISFPIVTQIFNIHTNIRIILLDGHR